MSEINQSKYSENFKEESDSSVTFIGDRLEVLIPDYYFQKKISTFIGRELETMGIFDAYIYDPVVAEVDTVFDAFSDNDMDKFDKNIFQQITFSIPSTVTLTPSNIEERNFPIYDEDSDSNVMHTFYVLEFLKGDTFIKTTHVIKSLPALKKFVDLLFGGFIPKNLSYGDILDVWEECNIFNGAGNLGVNSSILAMIVSEIVRDKDNLSRPYRLRLAKSSSDPKTFNGRLVRLMDLPKFISPFAAMTSADPKHGITIAITKEKTGDPSSKEISPVERDIS